MRSLIFILAVFIVFSGCVEEREANQSTDLVSQSTEPLQKESANQSSTTLSSEEGNIPEVEVTSFSSIYMHDNSEAGGGKTGYNITENYYAIYGLSIKNNGSHDFDFKLNDLHVRDGNHIFNATILDPYYGFYGGSILHGSTLKVLSNLKKENKIENMTLSPRQTINGSVAFQVNSLYNESFLLIYNETPIHSPSFERSIEALEKAEHYNYSVAFDIPPYYNGDLESFEANLTEYPYIYWVNRSIFEYINRVDSENVLRSSPKDIDSTTIVYVLKAIPERNITMLPVKSPQNRLLVVDENGKELINDTSWTKITIFSNETYKLYSRENMTIQEKNLADATIVRTSFERYWKNTGLTTISCNNQDVILDDSQNIIVASYDYLGMHGP